MKKYIFYIIFLALVFSSCDLKEDFDVEKSKVVEAAGQWWVNYADSAGGESGYILLNTFNASADDGTELWITDQGGAQFWQYKVKVPINIDQLTFSGTNLSNEVYESSVDILNGQVFLKGGKSTSGVVTDSIAFDIIFNDSGPEGTTPELYKVYGHRRTGFLEDEH